MPQGILYVECQWCKSVNHAEFVHCWRCSHELHKPKETCHCDKCQGMQTYIEMAGPEHAPVEEAQVVEIIEDRPRDAKKKKRPSADTQPREGPGSDAGQPDPWQGPLT